MSTFEQIGKLLDKLKLLSMRKFGMLCVVFAFAVLALKYDPHDSLLAQWPAVGFAGLFAVFGVLLAVRREPGGSAGFMRLEDDTWRSFFERAYANYDRDGGALQVDLVAHSLWSHFKPSGWVLNSQLDTCVDAIRRLEFDTHLWDGLRARLSNADIHLRVMIIKPEGRQSELVERQQDRTHESGRDRGRRAREDGIRTLFVLSRLQANNARLKVTARVLKEGDLTMTYSLCRVGNAVLVGHYPFDLLSSGTPCSEFDKEQDHVGRLFWQRIDALFTNETQSAHSFALPLKQAPEPYDEFKQWVLNEVR